MADGWRVVEARSAAKGQTDPDMRAGMVETSGCVNLRSHTFRAALLWSLDFRNALLQADGLYREVYFQALPQWDRQGARRVWRLRAPACELNDAAAAFFGTLNVYLLRERGPRGSLLIRICISFFVYERMPFGSWRPVLIMFRVAASGMFQSWFGDICSDTLGPRRPKKRTSRTWARSCPRGGSRMRFRRLPQR